MRRRTRVAKPPPQIIDPPRSNQLLKPAPVRLPEQRPRIDDPLVLDHPGSGSVTSVEGHQPHSAPA